MNIFKRIKNIFVNILEKYFASSGFYVNGPDNLPPPLSKEEEEKAFLLL